MSKNYIGSTGIKKIFNLIKSRISVIGYEMYTSDIITKTIPGKGWTSVFELNNLPYGLYLAIGSFGVKNWEGYFTISLDKYSLRDSIYIPYSSINNLSCCVMQAVHVTSSNKSIKLYVFPNHDIPETSEPFGGNSSY